VAEEALQRTKILTRHLFSDILLFVVQAPMGDMADKFSFRKENK